MPKTRKKDENRWKSTYKDDFTFYIPKKIVFENEKLPKDAEFTPPPSIYIIDY